MESCDRARNPHIVASAANPGSQQPKRDTGDGGVLLYDAEPHYKCGCRYLGSGSTIILHDILICAEVNVVAICQRILKGITYEKSYM